MSPLSRPFAFECGELVTIGYEFDLTGEKGHYKGHVVRTRDGDTAVRVVRRVSHGRGTPVLEAEVTFDGDVRARGFGFSDPRAAEWTYLGPATSIESAESEASA